MTRAPDSQIPREFTLPLSSLGFLFGVVTVQQFSNLPSPSQLSITAAVAALLAYRPYWFALFFMLGLLWASLFGLWLTADRLPADFENRDVTIQGYVASLPQRQERRTSFDFAITQPNRDFPKKIRLNWYSPTQTISAGQSWQLTVKLKRPHGRLNPGGFDYEAWLFANHIGATGYVRSDPLPRTIDSAPSLTRFFCVWRQSIADRLDAALPAGKQTAIIKALTIGSQDAIGQDQWDVFRRTGTMHLIVISGSHISLIAGLFFGLIRRGWAWLGILSISPQRAAAFGSWLIALFYAGLAGYSIPTLRAVIMLSVAMAAIVWQRNTSPMQILLLALLAVLLFDPLAVLSVGFWLSFAAVALLIYVASGRLGRVGYWREIAWAQIAVTVGLSPLLIAFFQQVSLISPLANWVAVPVIGLLVVPPALLGIPLLFVLPALARPLLLMSDMILQILWLLLSELADLPLATLSCPQPSWPAVMLAGAGVILMLSPRGFPARYLSALLFLPLFFGQSDKPQHGMIWLTMLDVGQGLSSVLSTSSHTLVFDSGARYGEYSDMGESVVVPFLHQQGIKIIDTLLISHDDNDHSGGADSILAEIPVENIVSSDAKWAERAHGRYCRTGQSWEWDGVIFQMLSPPETAFATQNDNSCVLRVTAGAYRVLLTGDIETSAEAWLAERYGNGLNSTVLIAPHHGSNTGSSMDFLQQVKPQWILISSGYLNRFGFPHAKVLERYRQLNARWLNSAYHGALTVRAGKDIFEVITERNRHKRYWMTFGGNELETGHPWGSSRFETAE